MASRYLAWLAEHTEYALSGIEAEVAAHATGRDAASPSEPADEAGPGAARPDGDSEPDETASEPERDSASQDRPSR
jgi:hypothetical protein